MLAITIVLFVVPHNQQIVTIRQFFTCRIPLFRNQNLNIQKNNFPFVSLSLLYYKLQYIYSYLHFLMFFLLFLINLYNKRVALMGYSFSVILTFN